MSEIRVNNIKNEAGSGAPTFPNGATIIGTLTGTATTAQGLTGTPNITVGTIGATSLNASGVVTATSFVGAVTGNVTGNATGLSGSPSITVSAIDSTGISTLTDLRLASVADKITVSSGNSPSLSYNTGGGNVAVVHTATGPITLTVTGIPTTSDFNNRSLNFAVIVKQGATGYACTDLILNGVAFGARAAAGVATDISYPSGTVATGSTSCYDIFNFIGINTTGSASTMTNYNFISIKNGDFRFY